MYSYICILIIEFQEDVVKFNLCFFISQIRSAAEPERRRIITMTYSGLQSN